MPAPALNEGQYEVIVRLASRRKGVSVPELVDRFDISRLLAWRALQRLVVAGRVHKMPFKRRRDMVYFNAGRGSDVYKAHADADRRQA